MYNAEVYKEQGGDKMVIGANGELEINGKLTVGDGATVNGLTGFTGAATASTLGGVKAAARDPEVDTVEAKIDSTSSKLYVAPPAEATTEAAGLVKQAANVPEAAGETPTAAEFKALLDALIAAGIMAGPA